MRENGLLHRPNHPKGLTQADKAAQKADNLIKRDFSASAPNQKMVTDITEYTASDGKLYVSAVFDCFDNACLGLCMDDNMRAELCADTFKQAALQYDLRGAIGHSDRGSQYTSDLFKTTLFQLGIAQSMNSAAGRCHEREAYPEGYNAKCESMWARTKQEIMACYDLKKMTRKQIHVLLYHYYFDYWNNRRICSAIGGVPPAVKRGAYFEMIKDQAA